MVKATRAGAAQPVTFSTDTVRHVGLDLRDSAIGVDAVDEQTIPITLGIPGHVGSGRRLAPVRDSLPVMLPAALLDPASTLRLVGETDFHDTKRDALLGGQSPPRLTRLRDWVDRIDNDTRPDPETFCGQVVGGEIADDSHRMPSQTAGHDRSLDRIDTHQRSSKAYSERARKRGLAYPRRTREGDQHARTLRRGQRGDQVPGVPWKTVPAGLGSGAHSAARTVTRSWF
jgi:hypothetical protein